MFVKGRVACALLRTVEHGVISTPAGEEPRVIDEKDITPLHDVIFIKPRMDYGTKQRVQGEAMKFSVSTKSGKTADDIPIDLGTWQIALLAHNIVGWQGPSFAGVTCSRANIEQLDDSEPLVSFVADEIGERNKDKTDPNSRTPTPDGNEP